MSMAEFIPTLSEKRILLASASPRRHHLLRELGIAFKVEPTDTEEVLDPTLSPSENAQEIAKQKAHSFQKVPQGTIVITADTLVSIDGKILQKPGDKGEAHTMLRQLAGRDHQVYTGFCLRSEGETRCFHEGTNVHFGELTDAEIRFYVDRYEPLDKAGAYGIQEWIGYIGVERIEGSYFNVMGLPVHRLYAALTEFTSRS